MKHSKAVGAWLAIYHNPKQEVVRRVRDTLLHADARIKETIKGEAPTFSYRGTLATIYPESKKHVSLMVPRGAEIPGHHPRLEGSGDQGRVMKIHDVAEAHAAKYDLQHLVRAWCDWQDAEAVAAVGPKVRVARKPAARKKAVSRKKAARPAAKKAPARPKTARPAKKSAARKVGSRKRVVRPAAKQTRKRARPRSR